MVTEPKACIISSVVLVFELSPSRDLGVKKNGDAVGVSVWERTTVTATGLGWSEMEDTVNSTALDLVAGRLYDFHNWESLCRPGEGHPGHPGPMFQRLRDGLASRRCSAAAPSLVWKEGLDQ